MISRRQIALTVLVVTLLAVLAIYLNSRWEMQ